MNRRTFFVGSMVALTGLRTFRVAAEHRPASNAGSVAKNDDLGLDLCIAVIGAEGTLKTGIEFGATEAQHAAALMKRSILIRTFADSAHPVRVATADACAVVIHAGASAALEPLAEAARDGAFVLLNTGDSTPCGPFVFHLPQRRGELASWHASLERYGAGQLNARYEAAYSTEMDSAAWTGWLAVKIAWEAAARVRSAEPRAIADYLSRSSTVFDGHKGRPLRFTPTSRVLDQPYYRIDGNGNAEEVIVPAPGECES